VHWSNTQDVYKERGDQPHQRPLRPLLHSIQDPHRLSDAERGECDGQGGEERGQFRSCPRAPGIRRRAVHAARHKTTTANLTGTPSLATVRRRKLDKPTKMMPIVAQAMFGILPVGERRRIACSIWAGAKSPTINPMNCSFRCRALRPPRNRGHPSSRRKLRKMGGKESRETQVRLFTR
jgi:hypothetical protein